MTAPSKFSEKIPSKTLILSGYGTNCEKETVFAAKAGGADQVDVVHLNQIYSEGVNLDEYGFLIFIGGFLDGDDLGSGRAGANRFRYRPLPGGGTFLEHLQQFIAQGRLVLGICNGFQLLVKTGVLPGLGENRQQFTLAHNENGRFEDRWVHLAVDPTSPCIFTRDIENLELPVRHGEGCLLPESKETLAALERTHLVPLRYALSDGTPTMEYPANPNGSPGGMASLCNPSGTVMGLMPHPEAFNHYTNHPRWTRSSLSEGDEKGISFFRNAYKFINNQ